MSSILYNFGNFPQSDAAFYELSTTNTGGQTTDVWTKVSTCKVWIYTTSSIQLDKANQFVNQEVGNILYIPSEMLNESGKTFDITKPLKAIIGSIDYFIEGKDNISRFDEMEVLLYRKAIV